jgi:hypothetical protein
MNESTTTKETAKMTKHTYDTSYQARMGTTGDRVCTIPDHVASNQEEYDGKTFVAIIPAGYRGTGTATARKMRVRLVGDDYGLHTSGTGDVVVRPVAWIK